MAWFGALLLLVALERVAELVISRRNMAWSLSRGGHEHGAGHYPLMVLLHTALLVGALTEVAIAQRPFLPVVGWLMLGLVLASQALRWWCIAALGRQWNTRVIVVPSLELVTRGPYKLARHPNYVAVAVEGAALPLVHSAWLTAALFTALNLALLKVRIRTENDALKILVSG